ncbi:unnamed protein product [Gordionus sp. m RMFG-2023]
MLNDSDKWKIQRNFKEKRFPAVLNLEDMAYEIVFLVIIIALLAILPGMKNKMIKQWVKIFISIAVAAILICGLTEKNWIYGRADTPLFNFTEFYYKNDNDDNNQNLLNTTLPPQLIPNIEPIYARVKVNIGLDSLNVSIVCKNKDYNFLKHIDTLNAKMFAFNDELRLLERNHCSVDYLRALSLGWPNSLLNLVEYLANGYHHFYFAGPEFSWCDNFRRAGYITDKFLKAAIIVLIVTWILYVQSMISEAALGTCLLGALMISANLSYVMMISQIAQLESFDYVLTEVSLNYLRNANRKFEMHQVIFPSRHLKLWFGWSFWSVFGTGCICIASGMSIYTAYNFYPQFLIYAFDELTLAHVLYDLNIHAQVVISPNGGEKKNFFTFKSLPAINKMDNVTPTILISKQQNDITYSSCVTPNLDKGKQHNISSYSSFADRKPTNPSNDAPQSTNITMIDNEKNMGNISIPRAPLKCPRFPLSPSNPHSFINNQKVVESGIPEIRLNGTQISNKLERSRSFLNRLLDDKTTFKKKSGNDVPHQKTNPPTPSQINKKSSSKANNISETNSKFSTKNAKFLTKFSTLLKPKDAKNHRSYSNVDIPNIINMK